jgi:hypothetical protein
MIARVIFVTQPLSNLGSHLVDGNLLAGHGLINTGYLARDELSAVFETSETVFSKSRQCSSNRLLARDYISYIRHGQP